jgi:DNA polymerase III alpha subunit (gram-positive type)
MILNQVFNNFKKIIHLLAKWLLQLKTNNFINSMNDINIFILDVETTGFKNEEIIEFAILNVTNEDMFHSFIKPQSNNFAFSINFISNSLLESAPSVTVFIKKFLDWMKKYQNGNHQLLLGHNVLYDKRVLKKTFQTINEILPKEWKFGDTIKLFKKVWQKNEVENYQLQNLLNKKGISSTIQHRSQADVKSLWNLLQKAIQDSDISIDFIKKFYL